MSNVVLTWYASEYLACTLPAAERLLLHLSYVPHIPNYRIVSLSVDSRMLVMCPHTDLFLVLIMDLLLKIGGTWVFGFLVIEFGADCVELGPRYGQEFPWFGLL